MAFLHRVVNGGGSLEREYAIGSDRMDLCLSYGKVTLGIELKVWRDKKGDPLEDGLEQLESYLAIRNSFSGECLSPIPRKVMKLCSKLSASRCLKTRQY